jgi:deoxyribodipyrimidine photo-lyase
LGKLDQLAANPRVTVRREAPPDPEGRCVVYWMQRSQRGVDNPALDIAIEAANALALPCVVFFAPIPFYPHANLRHYAFLVQGITDIAEAVERRGCGFVLRRWPEHHLARFCEEVRPALVVGDENPLRETEQWRVSAARQLNVPLWTVDSDVVVPSRLISKVQYAARFMRLKLAVALHDFLHEPANPSAHIEWQPPSGSSSLSPSISLDGLTEGWPLDRSVQPVTAFTGGTNNALVRLRHFVRNIVPNYPKLHSAADQDGTSRLSPYLHFGHISPVRVAWEVQGSTAPEAAKKDFLDQLITWRELSINFVRYSTNYDCFECAEQWAQRTLASHARDERPVIYTPDQLEHAETADDLWNAAQRQMLTQGWMHNYLRMYWAKKILEWSPTPQQAYATAVHLNDKYFLDGRDPNGYAGIAWSIAGKFDRPWFERPIFGNVRYMARSGAEKKFDVESYIANAEKLAS